MDFHDLDFVAAPGAPGPIKSGVEGLDFVGLKLFTFCGFRFVEAVDVFSRNVSTKSEAPTPPGQFFGGSTYIYIYVYIYTFIYLSIYLYK